MSVHFSSKSDEWETPLDFYAKLDAEFRFELDPCCTPENKKCATYITTDGLGEDWIGKRAFVNPPYGNLAKWIEKCAHEAGRGSLCVMLIPSRTDTKAFHRFIWDNSTHKPRTGVELRLLPGRLKFGGSKNSAPFPSCLVIFRPNR